MYPIEKRLPNLLTFANLFSGFTAVLACLSGDLVLAGWMIFIAAIADLLDGMAAKLLHAQSALGGQLDSLTDMVSFGLAPGLIAYMLLVKTHAGFMDWVYFYDIPVMGFLAFLVTAAAAYRLARFNVNANISEDNRFIIGSEIGDGIAGQASTSSATRNDGSTNPLPLTPYHFKGLPTPAVAMFFASLPLMLEYQVFVIKFDIYSISAFILNPYFLVISILLFSWLIVSRISLMSFKINTLKSPQGKVILVFSILSALLFVFLLWASVPLILLMDIILSYITKNARNEKT